MLEHPPKINFDPETILSLITNPEYRDCFKKIEDNYCYWDKAKYNGPKGVEPEIFWAAVKFTRLSNAVSFGKYTFKYKVTDCMQKHLHDFDMNFGGAIFSDNLISDKTKRYHLLNSIMEEAIASSQMEGASTTRHVAKEMLRKQAKPKDTGQQMIVNNYNTIRFLSEKKAEPLSKELLLEIHRMISEKTLETPEEEGQFRSANNIVVLNSITGEVAHYPPDCEEIEDILNDLCDFANADRKFIHPIVKAIIIHFVISFLHPFTDGNGRTARSLFYWYMLKKGYWLTEFLSISRIMYASKASYEKAFLYTEQDEYDLGYFIQYNLLVLNQSFIELRKYLERKTREQTSLLDFQSAIGINERQARIIKIAAENPKNIFISKELQTELGVSVKTIRTDLEGLVRMGLLKAQPLNKRLVGYVRSDNFQGKLGEIKGN